MKYSPSTYILTMKVRFKRLSKDAIIPGYSKNGDAGLDITATNVVTATEAQITYGTGLAIEIPSGYVGLLFPRSSIRGTCLSLSNSVGVIDSGYRGEIRVTFNKVIKHGSSYNMGERIAQLIIMPYPHIVLEETDDLSSTERGVNGFGSTGK